MLGRFSGDAWLRVTFGGSAVAELPMSFLHHGLPLSRRKAVHRESAAGGGPSSRLEEETLSDPGGMLLRMLSHPTTASKERIVRTYDHEVRGGTLVRPFSGPQMDGPSDGAVLKPLGSWSNDRAFALSVGINPLLGKRDPYAMAVSAIDEAFRNAVAVGADPDRIALLDNFCWGNPTLPDRLGALVRACQGCYDGAVAYNAPFISGKDSLYNEFDGMPIPATLLISAIGIVPDMRRTCTSDLKQAGNLLYLLGESRNEFGGSLLYHLLGREGGAPPELPDAPLTRYRALHALLRGGLAQSCHDLERRRTGPGHRRNVYRRPAGSRAGHSPHSRAGRRAPARALPVQREQRAAAGRGEAGRRGAGGRELCRAALDAAGQRDRAEAPCCVKRRAQAPGPGRGRANVGLETFRVAELVSSLPASSGRRQRKGGEQPGEPREDPCP